MKPLTLEAIQANPELLAALEARARRARAEAVGALVLRLIRRLTSHADRQRTAVSCG